MRLSIQENVRRISKKKMVKVSDWHRFRGKTTLSYAICKSGTPENRFGAKYVYKNRTDSKIMAKWLSGKAAMYRISAASLDKQIGGILEFFDLPLFELLADEAISERRINSLLKQYRATQLEGAPTVYWKFPNYYERLSDKTFVPVVFQFDTQGLFTYNDIYSFTALVGIVRIAEARSDADQHLSAFKDLVRTLPAVLRLPWIAPHADMLFELIKRLKARMWFTLTLFDIDLEIVWKQAKDANHQPVRERRPKDPITRRFIELEDPVLEAEITHGSEVKRRRLLKENRLAKKKIKPN